MRRPSRTRSSFLGMAMAFATMATELGVDEVDHVIAPRLEIARVLRESRDRDADVDLLRARLRALQDDAVEPAFELLVARRVPATAEGEREQILSRPQTDLLLEALAGLDADAVSERARGYLGESAELAARIAGTQVLGAVGDPDDLAFLLEHTWTSPEAIEPALEPVVEKAVAGILRRRGGAFERLEGTWHHRPEPCRPVLVRAAGSSGDPRALRFLLDVLGAEPGLAQLAMSQVRLVGPSKDAGLNRDLAARLRPFLSSRENQEVRAACLAVGELDDSDAIEGLIGLLDHGVQGIRENAHWALQRITGLALLPSPPRWRAWHHEELEWFEQELTRHRRALFGRDESKRIDAVRSYSRRRIRRDELARDLASALEFGRPTTRVLICESLETMGSHVALPELVASLDDRSPDVQDAAWSALKRITGEEIPKDPDAWRTAIALGS